MNANRPKIVFEHPFKQPPKKYHIKKNIIGSITLNNLAPTNRKILSLDDKK